MSLKILEADSNLPPIAEAGPDQTVLVRETVTLDGSASADTDGNPLTYQWTLISVPPGSSAQLSDPTKVMPTFVADLPGSYVAQLTVNDGKVDSAPDQVVITTENSVPVANAGPDQTIPVGETVTLDGSGSMDADGDSLTYEWALISTPQGSAAELSDPAAIMPTFVADLPGSYVAQLIVNDGQVDSLPDQVVITTENSAPVADAGPDQTIPVGETVTLDGSGSTDVDGDTLTYQWALLSTPPGSSAELSDPTAIMPTFVADLSGSYVAQLTVNDGKVDSAPDQVVITTENSVPVANAGPDQTIPVGETVTLDGSGSMDADGDSLTYEWALISTPQGSAAELSDPTAIMPTFVADLPGSYVAQLIVNDGQVDSAPDQVVITTENSVPVADAGPDQTIPVGDSVTLDGSGSMDADGDPLSYQWALLSTPPGSTAVLSDPTAIMPTFVADLEGNYVAQLIVNDGQVDSAPDTVLLMTLSGQPLACGDLVAGSIDQAGEEDILTFTGQTGDVIDITLVDTGGEFAQFGSRNALATVFSPSGAEIATISNVQQSITLPESGTYIVRLNANNLTSTGTYNLGLECRNPLSAVDGALDCGGLLSGEIVAPGEVDLITFAGQTNDVIDMTLVDTGGEFAQFGSRNALATVFSPSGAEIATISNVQQSITLPESGTYIVRLNANNLTSTGTYNLGLECRNPLSAVDDTLDCGNLFSGDIVSVPTNKFSRNGSVLFIGSSS